MSGRHEEDQRGGGEGQGRGGPSGWPRGATERKGGWCGVHFDRARGLTAFGLHEHPERGLRITGDPDQMGWRPATGPRARMAAWIA
jgi:hypothetical protein